MKTDPEFPSCPPRSSADETRLNDDSSRAGVEPARPSTSGFARSAGASEDTSSVHDSSPELQTPTSDQFQAERFGSWHLPLDFLRNALRDPLPRINDEDLLNETLPPMSARDRLTDPKGFELSAEEVAVLRGPKPQRRGVRGILVASGLLFVGGAALAWGMSGEAAGDAAEAELPASPSANTAEQPLSSDRAAGSQAPSAERKEQASLQSARQGTQPVAPTTAEEPPRTTLSDSAEKPSLTSLTLSDATSPSKAPPAAKTARSTSRTPASEKDQLTPLTSAESETGREAASAPPAPVAEATSASNAQSSAEGSPAETGASSPSASTSSEPASSPATPLKKATSAFGPKR